MGKLRKEALLSYQIQERKRLEKCLSSKRSPDEIEAEKRYKRLTEYIRRIDPQRFASLHF